MKKFFIIERQACEVIWRYPVLAETAEEAFQKYADGDHGESESPLIGDSLDAYQFDLDIEEVEI